MDSPQPDTTPRVLLSIEAAAERLSIGRTTMYALVKSGQIKTVRVGRRRLVPTDELTAYINRIATDEDNSTA
jgi:excisionase family DNA binding protein